MSYAYLTTERNGMQTLLLPREFNLDVSRVELDWKDGCIVIKPSVDSNSPYPPGDVRALKGIVKWDGPPVTLEEMDEAIAEEASKEFL